MEEYICLTREGAESLKEYFEEGYLGYRFIDARTHKSFDILSVELMPANPEVRNLLWGKIINPELAEEEVEKYKKSLNVTEFTVCLISSFRESAVSIPQMRIDHLRQVVDAETGELSYGFGIVIETDQR